MHIPAELILGGMGGGKTSELIKKLRQQQVRRRDIQAFKPVLDSRYASNELVTRDGLKFPAESIIHSYEIMDKIKSTTEVIGIDEVTFLDDQIIGIINELEQQGRTVIISGLIYDFRGQFFPLRKEGNVETDSYLTMLDLMNTTHNWNLRPSMCMHEINGGICGINTFFVQRYFADGITIAPKNEQTIMIGKEHILKGEDHLKRVYIPKCKEHFVQYD
jgi:thymidine kinase